RVREMAACESIPSLTLPPPWGRQGGPRAMSVASALHAFYLEIDRLERVVVRHLRGACGEADDQVHLGAEHDVVAGPGARRIDLERAARQHLHVHEDIERRRNAIGLDPVCAQ